MDSKVHIVVHLLCHAVLEQYFYRRAAMCRNYFQILKYTNALINLETENQGFRRLCGKRFAWSNPFAVSWGNVAYVAKNCTFRFITLTVFFRVWTHCVTLSSYLPCHNAGVRNGNGHCGTTDGVPRRDRCHPSGPHCRLRVRSLEFVLGRGLRATLPAVSLLLPPPAIHQHIRSAPGYASATNFL